MVDPNELNICRHCSEKKELAYCEDCYQELIAENAKLQKDLHDFKSEHDIMKKMLIDHGLWEELLNNDKFLKYLREDYEG